MTSTHKKSDRLAWQRAQFARPFFGGTAPVSRANQAAARKSNVAFHLELAHIATQPREFLPFSRGESIVAHTGVTICLHDSA
ncbi:hypothetical protein WI89_15165 [Burkholderia ubonensis]|uniref:hypothetical protein n=1 Tax=Burkholderia ubonensis TaxID=101571 RepID=UPI00075BF3A4|nr:hypothetical protein [Burkholderia ubonensis]KVD71583.1 hypothetical protein WI89_15165 [Burkholderia ubonensis]